MIPWDEWWEMALKDSSNPQIALLPLHPEVRAKFNNTAAWEYARQMSGKPYGYHNMIFSWIDTVADNYPPPLDAHLVRISVWTKMGRALFSPTNLITYRQIPITLRCLVHACLKFKSTVCT